MSEFNVRFPENFLLGLLETDFDDIAIEALEEAAPILEEAMKKNCRAVIEHEGDSELVDSIKATKPKKSRRGGWFANVEPSGYSTVKKYTAMDNRRYRHVKTQRKYPVSNGLKAIWKEYGIPGRQAARPFITASINASKKEVMERMQEIYNKKVGAGSGTE